MRRCDKLFNPQKPSCFQEADACHVTKAKSPRRSYKRTRSHWWRIRGVNYGGRRNRYRVNQSVAAHLAIHLKSHPPLINLLNQRGKKTRFHNGIMRARRVNVEDWPSTDYAAETNFIARNRVKTSVALLSFPLFFQYRRKTDKKLF